MRWRGCRSNSHVWRLRRAGYRTICLHPFDRRFFRRDLAMPALGFEQFLGRETLGGSRTPPYYSDPRLAADILRDYRPARPRGVRLRDHDGQPWPLAGAGTAHRSCRRKTVRPDGNPGRGWAAALSRRAEAFRRDAADPDVRAGAARHAGDAGVLRRSPAEPVARLRPLRFQRSVQRLRDLARRQRRCGAAVRSRGA